MNPKFISIDDVAHICVVELPTIPDFPFTWRLPGEEPYIRALNAAVQTGQIKEPGTYTIHVSEYHVKVDLEYEVIQT